MVYVYLATGFEEIEALTVVDVLRRAEVDVKAVSITGDRLVLGSRDITVQADLLFEEADYDDCEMIVLPGGMPGAANLGAHKGLTDHIKVFAKAGDSGRKLAAICAAPMVLGACGVLEGHEATIYPGMEDHLIGAKPTGENVTVSGNIITGKGPALAMEFALTLVEILKGAEKRKEVAEGLLTPFYFPN
ncbi:MAG: DJ-1/PfpI family protein [Mogibacterium sp.]|nr:DJ-1/PfpI family protein [Mogibacterium sp.]